MFSSRNLSVQGVSVEKKDREGDFRPEEGVERYLR